MFCSGLTALGRGQSGIPPSCVTLESQLIMMEVSTLFWSIYNHSGLIIRTRYKTRLFGTSFEYLLATGRLPAKTVRGGVSKNT